MPLGSVRPRLTVLITSLMQLTPDQQELKQRIVKAHQVWANGNAALAAPLEPFRATAAAAKQGDVTISLSEQQVNDILGLGWDVGFETNECDQTLRIKELYVYNCKLKQVWG